MLDEMSGGPDQVLDSDLGDETASRYVYQYTCAAMLACALLDDSAQVSEVFCEHHEDVLLKGPDGRFTGCQVKTRQESDDHWLATEDQILGALARFVELEAQFGALFRGYVIISNHPFKTGESGTRLPFLLAKAQECNSISSADKRLGRLIVRLRKRTEQSEQAVIAALQKTTIRDDYPKRADVLTVLCGDLAQAWVGASSCSMGLLAEVAQGLVELCGRASSLAHQQLVPRYLGVAQDAGEAEVAARIEGKRIDRAKLENLLEDLSSSTAQLDGPPDNEPAIGAGSRSVLEKKLDRGGFSVVSVNSAQDLRSKADYLSLQWMYRLGERGARQRSHIRTLVLADCAAAHEANKDQVPSGVKMLETLRGLFALRRQGGASELHGCSDEHLEGHAYALTSECQVWWSHPFDLEEGP